MLLGEGCHGLQGDRGSAGAAPATLHKQLASCLAADLRPCWPASLQVLWPRDIFFNGNRGCLDGADARALRSLLHAMHGTRLPPPGAAPPATITLQRKSANRRIVNEGEVVAMLREFGEVRLPAEVYSLVWRAAVGSGAQASGAQRSLRSGGPACAWQCLTTTLSASSCWPQVRVVEYGANSTLREQLEMAAGTGLFVSVHTSNLANALWLPPGAAVVEILQRNWAWEGAHGDPGGAGRGGCAWMRWTWRACCCAKFVSLASPALQPCR